MSIENSIKEFLKKLSVTLAIFDADLELSYETDVLSVFLQNINNEISDNPQLVTLLKIIDEFISDASIIFTENMNTYSSVQKIEVEHLSIKKETKFKVRNFAISTNVGAIIPLKYFAETNPYQITESERKLIERKIREMILYYGKANITQLVFSKVFNKLILGSKNTVFAVYNSNTSFIKLYSKCYFTYLLKGHKTIFPKEIEYVYKTDQSILTIVNSSSKDFTQFIEIFDVIDEYHHSNDVLVKYLKIYQIIEYFITRTILVKIQTNSSNQNLFLREMTSLSTFDDFDQKNFKFVFSSNETELTTWFISLLTGNPTLKLTIEKILYPNQVKTIDTANRPNSYNALLNLIYKLRNSIVHNKESEIHLTMHNIQLKKELIKLIKELLEKLEKTLFKKIADFENVITYQDSHLALY